MNFWNQIENTPKEHLQQFLLKKLGQPTNTIQQNLYEEILRKINSYYFQEEPINYSAYSLYGFVSEIQEKKYKEGKNRGQVFYNLKLGGANHKEKLQARKELLPEEKWKQVEKLAILGKNLVFKYRKWINNKQVLDFWEERKEAW
jgi:hypothetical protein